MNREKIKILFETVLLEFDPNRGKPGRAVPLIPHYPLPPEKEAALKVHPDLKDVNPRTGLNRLQGKKDRVYASLSPDGQAQMDAFRYGKNLWRWQGRTNEDFPVSKEQFAKEEAARETGVLSQEPLDTFQDKAARWDSEIAAERGIKIPPTNPAYKARRTPRSLRTNMLLGRAVNPGSVLMRRRNNQRKRFINAPHRKRGTTAYLTSMLNTSTDYSRLKLKTLFEAVLYNKDIN